MRQDPSLESAAAYEPCTTVPANEDTPPRLIGEFKPVDDLVIVPANFGAFATIKEAWTAGPSAPPPTPPAPDRPPRERGRAERSRSERGSRRVSGNDRVPERGWGAGGRVGSGSRG